MWVDLYQWYEHRDWSQLEAALELNRSEIDVLQNILGRRYDSVTIRAVPTDEEGVRAPYIVATNGDRFIDTAMMSQGELWVHYILNWLLRVTVQPGHLVLLDEPEAFLSIRALRPFIDEIARIALSKNLQIIIGTHNPEVLARFPPDHVHMCIRSTEGIRVIKPSSFLQIRDSVGLETPVQALVLVEDNFSHALLEAIIARYDVSLNRQIEIVAAGGETEVRADVRILQNARQIKSFGVLDADCSTRSLANSSDVSNDYLLLPGTESPEKELLKSAELNAPMIAGALNRTVDDLTAAIAATRSLDHQYQLPALAKSLGYPLPAVVSVLIQGWLDEPDVSSNSATLVQGIRERLGVS
jgi:AAA domain, putative AbiEii toxin, Type IV TA system